ncbi:MAG TPA: sporulation integral membrane protein YlbJ [Paenibacillus sp.]|uniref:sporulation integral membrane protein YlbJ n=1 Tax=Paenibacillus sp. TaxID=58172 RepID=UPI002BB1326E|nr:sporulation integral membrane protein YlbJ [Paenibacillus sp.]HUC91564.1 sporulation integral membrane protein YlbJ [Paenibacillus sp.]
MLRYLLRPASLPTLLCAALLLLGLYYPAASLNASVRGLTIWWEVLFPALFPFFVLSELMLGFGIVHFFGTLMDPLMRPLFRLPGISGFVVAMGYISGYPVGARLTAQLRERGQITQAEGERMVAFTTTSDPIFLIGAVSVGFFHNAALAPVLAAAHYGSGLIIGLLARFHEPRAPGTPPAAAKPGSRFLLSAALSAMHEAMQADGRKLGRLLQDAIGSALRLMTVVGGLVVFFSLVMELLTKAGTLDLLAAGLQTLLDAAGLPLQLSASFVNGLFEVTLGAKSSAETGAPLVHQAAVAAWALSWAGLSVHAQIASILSHTDLRYKPFLIARAVHGILAFALVYLLWGWLGP